MALLQQQFESAITNTIQTSLDRLVVEKLANQGITDHNLIGRIMRALRDSNENQIEVESDIIADIEFTSADGKHLNDFVEKFITYIPNIVENIGAEYGEKIADGVKQQWSDNSGFSHTEREDLKRKIANQWGEAFSDLRMLLEFCRQQGEEFNRINYNLRLKKHRTRNHVLARLHIRACRIADEIITLLENGFAEGARGRWRTLYEVAVAAVLISEGGDPLAERYMDHGAVEQKHALDDHDRANSVNANSEISMSERKEIEHRFNTIVDRYGSDFKGMHGWASGQIGITKNPQFHHLQDLAGTLTMKLQYRIACFGTHASTQSLKQPLHHWDPTIHILDEFEAGFEEPGTDTAYALVLVTSAIFIEPWDLDKLVLMSALKRLRDNVGEKMQQTANRIDRLERRNIERSSRRAIRSAHFRRKRLP
jgi:Family of unknown function (DUF5677)